MAERARIIIVGCGFVGLFAARALKRVPDVLVIDRNNYHLFQPLLYRVASAALAPSDIAQPIPTILRYQKNTPFHYRDWGSHVTVLIGFRNRLAVLASWVYSYVFFRRSSRLITRSAPAPQQPP